VIQEGATNGLDGCSWVAAPVCRLEATGTREGIREIAGGGSVMATDIAEIIANDHRTVENLFDEVRRGDGDARKVADAIIEEMTAHAAAEEQIFYPALRDMVPGGSQMATRAQKEHRLMKDMLGRLRRSQPGETEFESALRALASEVLSHAPVEENDWLPALRSVIGEDKMRELGRIFEEVKGTVPTNA
jgi:hemerythrin superfamily protein